LKVFVLIQVVNSEQAARNVSRARAGGADGVIFLSHDLRGSDLVEVFREVKNDNPEFNMGMNLLGMSCHVASLLSEGTDLLWMDGYPKRDLGLDIPVLASVTLRDRELRKTLSEEVKTVSQFADSLVVCGARTGSVPFVGRVRTLSALTPKPLCVASGLTSDNVIQFLPYVEYLLVGAGVSDSFSEVNVQKIKDFVRTVKDNLDG
jgi:uncharacterized protein